jgi:hypothetical protein
MMLNPTPGQKIQVWYRKSNHHLPFHAQRGVVLIPSKGKPRNHLVSVDGRPVVVPCGNVRKGVE